MFLLGHMKKMEDFMKKLTIIALIGFMAFKHKISGNNLNKFAFFIEFLLFLRYNNYRRQL